MLSDLGDRVLDEVARHARAGVQVLPRLDDAEVGRGGGDRDDCAVASRSVSSAAVVTVSGTKVLQRVEPAWRCRGRRGRGPRCWRAGPTAAAGRRRPTPGSRRPCGAVEEVVDRVEPVAQRHVGDQHLIAEDVVVAGETREAERAGERRVVGTTKPASARLRTAAAPHRVEALVHADAAQRVERPLGTPPPSTRPRTPPRRTGGGTARTFTPATR